MACGKASSFLSFAVLLSTSWRVRGSDVLVVRAVAVPSQVRVVLPSIMMCCRRYSWYLSEITQTPSRVPGSQFISSSAPKQRKSCRPIRPAST
ncbi:hypothetical protein L227DRAFT_79494 [Lentinus tigrinus ALCF2SS1-6]|uniref:Secreted protein n=1 Tax=Lentinus tigrinus ALCF2SS1-6 TaxID=1328759 RepID=A0A5C2SBT0_9APHY|nr:hypothetical protein L227DRAFT_79494 [Lentinus tigrinus ALCF2SS1-6]